jgi:hypothetical protein
MTVYIRPLICLIFSGDLEPKSVPGISDLIVMQIEYKPNRLTSTGLANGLEDFCLFRIAGKFRAQISETELSVLVQVKHPSSARLQVSRDQSPPPCPWAWGRSLGAGLPPLLQAA